MPLGLVESSVVPDDEKGFASIVAFSVLGEVLVRDREVGYHVGTSTPWGTLGRVKSVCSKEWSFPRQVLVALFQVLLDPTKDLNFMPNGS